MMTFPGVLEETTKINMIVRYCCPGFDAYAERNLAALFSGPSDSSIKCLIIAVGRIILSYCLKCNFDQVGIM